MARSNPPGRLVGKSATLVIHGAMPDHTNGTPPDHPTTAVTQFEISHVRPGIRYAGKREGFPTFSSHDRSVTIYFTPAEDPVAHCLTAVPGEPRYYTIERDGEVLYDSRSDIAHGIAAEGGDCN